MNARDTIGADEAAWIIRILNDAAGGAKARETASGGDRWRSARWLSGAGGEALVTSGEVAEPSRSSGTASHHGNA